MKRKLLYVSVLILIIFIFSLMIVKIFNKENQEIKTLKVAEVTHSIFYTPFYVAIENGYFKEVGIDIDLMLVSGSDNVAASVLSKDTDIGLAGPESAIFVYLGGEKDYLKVFSGLTKRDGQFIISRDSKDFKWEDLYNKEILIGRSTGMPALSFYKALENKNIDKDKVKINTSIDFAELSGTFIGGEGDYVNLFEPLASSMEKNNYGYVVTSVGKVSGEFPYTAFYARKSFIDENKEILEKFTKAIKKGMDYTSNNDSKKVAKSIQKQFSDTKEKDLASIIERYKEADVWLQTPFVEENFYNTIVTLLKDNQIIDKNVYYKDMVNNLYE